MRSAKRSEDGITRVTYVENCTCLPQRNVAGLSCGNCSQGYQRPTPASTLYSACTLCSCNSRTETTPPMCDEGSGTCLNCKNGSVGLHCEQCAPNVGGPGCDKCSPYYWGLTKTGCSNCSCDTLNSNPTIPCDSVTGQCNCNPLKNVSGLRCDQCQDNFVNGSSGCQPCSQCYGLVVDEMKMLRANQTSLSALVNNLLSKDNTSTLGPFSDRLNAALVNVTALDTFSSDAYNLELTLSNAITSLNATLLNLTVTIATTIAPSATMLTSNIQSAAASIAASLAAMNSTISSLIQTFNQLNNEMPVFTAKLRDLLSSLQNVLNSITGNSDAIINGIQLLNQTVVAIETNSATASASSQQALQSMQTIKSLLDSLMNNQLPSMEQSLQALNVTARVVYANANNAFNAATSLLINATSILDRIKSFSMNPVDVDLASASIQQQIATANSLTNQTLLAQSNSKPTIDQVQVCNLRTVQIVSQVNGNKSSVDALHNRILAANQTAANAVNLAQNTTNQAQRMLNIMSNFDSVAQGVQNQANASLSTVQMIRDLSQQASTSSDQILQSLQTSVASSSQALQLATQAINTANALNQVLSPVSDKANLLMTQSSSVLNDVQAKSDDIYQKNNSIVASLANNLNTYQSLATSLEARVQLARTMADNTSMQVRQTQNNITALQARLQTIPNLDSSTLQQLQANVQQLHTYYNSLQLLTTVAALNKTITDQRVWINDMKNRRDDLQQQIKRLQILLSQLRT